MNGKRATAIIDGQLSLKQGKPQASVLKFLELRKGKVARVKKKTKMKSGEVS